MKKLFLMFLAAVSITACDEAGKPGSIELGEGTPKEITIDADQTKIDNVKFTAKEAWTAEVNDVAAKAANVTSQWIKLSAYSGPAGPQSLSVTLEVNNTGADRRAEISIVSGATKFLLSVEQKGTKESEPEVPTPTANRYVKKIISTRGDYDSEILFEYNNDMRLEKMRVNSTDKYNGKEENYSNVIYFAYKGNTITLTLKEIENGVEVDGEENVFNIALNANGTVRQLIGHGIMSQDSSVDSVYYPNPNDPIVPSNPNDSTRVASLLRSVRGKIYSKAVTETPYTETIDYTYNAQGYVVAAASREESADSTGSYNHYQYKVSWSNGNLSEVGWAGQSSTDAYDVLKYGGTEAKHPNIDLSFAFSSGEWHSDLGGVVGMLGYMGRRSKMMPSSITSTYTSSSGSRSSVYNYTYTLDKQEGYVTGCVVTRPSPSTSLPETYVVEYVK